MYGRRQRRFDPHAQYHTACANCGRTTNKNHARTHDGLCAACARPNELRTRNHGRDHQTDEYWEAERRAEARALYGANWDQ